MRERIYFKLFWEQRKLLYIYGNVFNEDNIVKAYKLIGIIQRI